MLTDLKEPPPLHEIKPYHLKVLGPLIFRKGYLKVTFRDLSNQKGHLYGRWPFQLEMSCKGLVMALRLLLDLKGLISKTSKLSKV